MTSQRLWHWPVKRSPRTGRACWEDAANGGPTPILWPPAPDRSQARSCASVSKRNSDRIIAALADRRTLRGVAGAARVSKRNSDRVIAAFVDLRKPRGVARAAAFNPSGIGDRLALRLGARHRSRFGYDRDRAG